MSDSTNALSSPSGFASSGRFRAIVAVVLVAGIAAVAWYMLSRDRESTDDAQVEAHVSPIASRVGGVIARVAVGDNQPVEAGAVLIEIDPRDYQIAVDRSRAELADAEASAVAAESGVPMTSTTAAGGVSTAEGSVAQARGAVASAETEVELAKARLTTAEARLRETDANAAKAARDVERLRGLLAKDEVSQQQFEGAAAAADAQRASVDSGRSQVAEAQVGIRVAESRLVQARAAEQQALSVLKSSQTAPEQVAITKARAAAAQAQVQKAKATLAQAELNLQYTTITAPAKGIVSKKSVSQGQVVQAGQPLFALVQTDDVWVTANFKETQLTHVRPGQRVAVKVDADGGRTLTGKVDSISPATGARFSLLPPENATGNFVKVVQRIPVKIVLDPGQDPDHFLRPGMSVVPTVDTR